MTVLSKALADRIWRAHREIEVAGKLLDDMRKALLAGAPPTPLDPLDRRRHIELAVPTSEHGHRLFDLGPDLAATIIEAHIAEKREELREASNMARAELGEVGAAGRTAPTAVYLAARYSRWPQVRACRTELEALGHTVTSRWIDGDHQIDDGQTIDAQVSEKVRFAREDITDLVAAEVFIAFTEEPRAPLGTRGGRHIELGYALALGKRVIVVGWRENVFCWLPEVEFHDTWAAALDALRPSSLPVQAGERSEVTR